MTEITKIVVPVDLEKNTEKLVEYALKLGKALEAELILFHAVEFVTIGEMALGSISYEDVNESRRLSAEERIKELAASMDERIKKCTSRVSVGDISDEIVTFAESEGAGMIIIGTHGKHGLEKILLGSVAERVVQNATCPVLVMNPYK